MPESSDGDLTRSIAVGGPRRAFGHADERPYRRLTADWVKVPLACALVAIGAVRTDNITRAEVRVEQFFTSLSDGISGVFAALLGVGTLWGVGLVVAAALLARRWRLALVLGLAGALAWFFGKFVGLLTAGVSVANAISGVFNGRPSGSYPAVHLAVIAAVILGASPFLNRPTRRAGQVVLALAAIGVVVRGVGGVNDVLGALALAWGIAAALHLAFGSPAGRPTVAQVAASLAELGVAVERVALAPRQERGRTLMLAETVGTETAPAAVLPVTVYGRDAADTRLVAKAWRFLAYKDSGPTLTITRLQQVEHEALCLFAGREAGAHVPDVVVAGVAGPSAAILVTRLPPTTPLTPDLPALDATLIDLWRDLAVLRRARIAHGALDLEHVASTAQAPLIDDFATASFSAPTARLDQDVAQFLVASASLVGDDAAVATAVSGIGADAVGAALPYLQKPALTGANRRIARADKDLLDRLRERITAATGREPVVPVELRRVKPLNIALVVALLFALWLILAQIGGIGDLLDTLSTANWPWLVLGFLLAQATSVAFAFTTIGTVRDSIPLIPTTLLQMAVSFANLVATTGAASTVMNIRFLQKQGVEVGAATSSGVLAGMSGTIAQFSLFVITAFAVGEEASLSQIGGGGADYKRLILIVVFVAALVVGIALAIPRLRRFARDKVWPQVLSAVRNIWGILTNPRQLFTVVGGSVAAQLLYSFCLLSCLIAYGGRLSLGEIVFVNTSASFLAGLVPVPGGVGITEATLIAGLTAFGVPPEIATATVVTHRLFTTYLPPIWGSYAMKYLIREGYL